MDTTTSRQFYRLPADVDGEAARSSGWPRYRAPKSGPKGRGPVRLLVITADTTRPRPGTISSGEGAGRPDEDRLIDPRETASKKHWARISAGAWEGSPKEWATDEPADQKKVAEFQKATVEAFTKHRANVPPEYRPDHVYFFPEPHVSQRLTEGNYPEYWQGDPLSYTADETKRLKMFGRSAQYAAEAVRKEFPNLKVLIPWGDALFAVPLLRAGFPKNLIDGSGIDTPGFERLPEMQLHQISVHRLYELRKEYEKAGIPKPQLQYTEGIFVPTEPGAVSWREQMDIYNRWVLISMAYGMNRFYSGWFAFDCTTITVRALRRCGIQARSLLQSEAGLRRLRDDDHKLDRANPTAGSKPSLTAYCLRFKDPRARFTRSDDPRHAAGDVTLRPTAT